MEKLKERYLFLDNISNTVSEVALWGLLLLWTPLVIAHFWGAFLLEDIIFEIQAVIFVISGILSMLKRRTLKSFVLKGCETGEDVLDKYKVRLRKKFDIIPEKAELTSIFFKKDDGCYFLEMSLMQEQREIIVTIANSKLGEIVQAITIDE